MNHKRVCDLCGTRETEFTVTSKHLSYIDEDLKKYNEFNTNHIVKHICKDCIGETIFNGRKAYCKNRNCDLPVCDNFKPKTVDNMNKMTIEYFLKFHIDPDVLIKQKAEIELLQMKLKQFQKVNEGILNYIICRVTLGHKYDDFYRITPEATEDEQKVYNEALKFLRSLRDNIDN